ncbi:hypothetical protein BAST_0044 [Bifidobacterium asteroides PRL2011]|nr:hypothetical protein BAST_0044 [Bifidobacterium asteroides PRL2011]
MDTYMRSREHQLMNNCYSLRQNHLDKGEGH